MLRYFASFRLRHFAAASLPPFSSDYCHCRHYYAIAIYLYCHYFFQIPSLLIIDYYFHITLLRHSFDFRQPLLDSHYYAID